MIKKSQFLDDKRGMRKYTKDLLVIAFIVSLLFHGISGLIIYFKKPKALDKSVEVVFVDKNEIKKMQAKQIVEQPDKRLNDEIDEKAKYLSRFNQKVQQQTKAAQTGKFQNEARQGMAPKNQTQELLKQTPPKNIAKKTASKKTSDDGTVGLPKLSALKPQFHWDKVQNGVANPGPISQSDDHLKDVAVGPQTLLSSREFVYYSYYSRIKERIRIYWEPKIKDKITRIFMSGRKIASDEDRVTRLIIVLDRNGKLIKVQVMGESGLKDLDDAAVEAFQAAAPFPNPPAGIVEPDGTIKIRWDFIIEAQAGWNPIPGAVGEFAQAD